MGLDQVRELTKRTQGRIVRFRPFKSFSDFLTRVDPRPVEVENLVKVGGLDGMGSIPRLLDQLNTTRWQRGQLPLFEMDSMVLGVPTMDTSLDEDWSLADRVAAQVDILGASLDAHPLELASEVIDRVGAMTTVEAIERVGIRVQVAGMRQTWRRGSTSKGERLYVMSLEDLEGMLNVVIFMDVYRRVRRELSGSGPYLVTGEMALDQRTGEPYLRADQINRL
jgi:DNA polymerase-3 subunit alpha